MAIVIFLIEVAIALFVHDRFVRPYIGDVLVVILVYCGIKSFFKIRPLNAAIISFLFATLVEVGQYFHMVELLNLQDNKVASIIIGNSFSCEDIVAYLVGGVLVMVFEKRCVLFQYLIPDH